MIRRTAANALGAVLLTVAPLAAQDSTPTPPKPFSAQEEARFMALGKKAVAWFFAGEADSLYAMADSATKVQMGGIDAIRRQMDGIAERGGVPLNVLAEKMTRRRGIAQFWYEAEFSNFTQEPLVFRWLFNDTGELVGIGFGPRSGAPYDGKP